MAWGTDYECPHPSLGAWGTLTPCVGPLCFLGTWGGGLEPNGFLPSSLQRLPSRYNALRRGVKPVRTLHLGVTWGVYLCAGKPPLAGIILSHPPDPT